MTNPVQILAGAQNSNQAIKELYLAKKQANKNFSMGFISRSTGASKGYISDVMSGRRILNPRYWESFAKIFQLSLSEREVFQLLIALDLETDVDTKSRLIKELAAARKAIDFHTMTMPPQFRGLFFAFEVFCAFGLFANSPTKQDLRTYFGTSRAIELDRALQLLLHMKVIRINSQRFEITENSLAFTSSEDGLSYKDFLKDSLKKAEQAIEEWLPTNHSILESTIISVKKSDFLKLLPKIKSDIHRMQADLETDQGDQLIRFNLQIYPNSKDHFLR